MAQTERPPADRLLLVDDNPTNLQILFQALEAEGYELLVAQSGEEALVTAQEARPQLILLDINMPGIDGYETCRRLQAQSETRDAAVIFLSARGDVDDKVQGLAVGAVDYIGKPFQFEEVVARVRKHLETYHQQRELREKTQQLEEQLAGGFEDLTDDRLKAMAAQGEGETVEFKSTLRWNLHTGKADKRIENACLKTVAAYLNSNGGVLLVGVDDRGTALGLDHDRFANMDKMLLHWNNLIKSHLGVQCAPQVRSTLGQLDHKPVLVIQCLPAPQPVFLRRDNDEMFCIRTGNGSQPLKPSEILAYLDQRHAEPAPAGRGRSQKDGQLGRYTIDKQIGTGAMGVVYRGHHAMLHRPAAIKMLDSSRANEQSIARFEREVQMTSQLNHPNTIAIYDYGRTADGAFYYVMEYLDGLTLDELVQQYGPQPEGRVIFILKQICGSLAEAHEAGLIHRDIKPANVMLSHRGGLYDFAKLLDFGLVKAVDGSDQAALTATGAITGTPMYLAPEAITGTRPIDARSDLYALGAVGYYLLAGWPVFTGRSAIDVCRQHTECPPQAPAEKRGEPISPDLEGLVLKCLAKDPDLRPATARALLHALNACQKAHDWTEEKAAAWWRKERPDT